MEGLSVLSEKPKKIKLMSQHYLCSCYVLGSVLKALHVSSSLTLTALKVGTIIMPALQIRKLKLREII